MVRQINLQIEAQELLLSARIINIKKFTRLYQQKLKDDLSDPLFITRPYGSGYEESVAVKCIIPDQHTMEIKIKEVSNSEHSQSAAKSSAAEDVLTLLRTF